MDRPCSDLALNGPIEWICPSSGFPFVGVRQTSKANVYDLTIAICP